MSPPGGSRRARRPAAAAADPALDTAAAPAEAGTPELTDAEIHDQLQEAIGDHRLQPGTRLREDELGRLFGVSRTRVRQVLIRLAQEKLVTLTPHRGAAVSRPSEREAREVFEARRLIEPFLAARAGQTARPALWAALDENIRAEEAARAAGDRHRVVRLSGEFHLRLAEGADHDTLTQVLRSLVMRSSLALMAHGAAEGGAAPPSSCHCDAHRALLDALRAGHNRELGDLLVQHLQALEDGLRLGASADDRPAAGLASLRAVADPSRPSVLS